ncbi:MAG: response regulator transcription factor [Sphingobacteriia bacterium]|jgi:DNA-binding LytR/AlgR family response regulator|nr:response regulator transcription factor [Sphingobacteriia bacterium]
MNKIQVAIIEDEIPAARLLHSIVIKLRPDWEVIILSGSVEENVQWFSTHKHPDILFLDIQLSDGTSFEFLSATQPSSVIIFTTAYDQYALRAFTVNSIDYLLKPVDEQRLLEAIEKYEKLIAQPISKTENYLENILSSLQAKSQTYRTRFLIPLSNQFKILEVEDIAYFYSENKITTAVTFSGQEHILDMSLNALEEQLNPVCFFRANRQMLLNIKAITRIEPYFNGKIAVKLKPAFKSSVIISEEKKTAFKDWLNQ